MYLPFRGCGVGVSLIIMDYPKPNSLKFVGHLALAWAFLSVKESSPCAAKDRGEAPPPVQGSRTLGRRRKIRLSANTPVSAIGPPPGNPCQGRGGRSAARQPHPGCLQPSERICEIKEDVVSKETLRKLAGLQELNELPLQDGPGRIRDWLIYGGVSNSLRAGSLLHRDLGDHRPAHSAAILACRTSIVLARSAVGVTSTTRVPADTMGTCPGGA